VRSCGHTGRFAVPAPFGRSVTITPGDVRRPLSSFPTARLGGRFLAAALPRNSQDIPVLIHRPPQVLPFAIAREEGFVQGPFGAWRGTSAPPLSGIRLTER
jgi:hypothetical protein